MKGKRLRIFRIAVSIVLITAITFLFIDRYEVLPVIFHKIVLWLQFIPSALNFYDNPGYLYFGFIVILLLTLLFGRVYCSFLCPLGVLQDISDYFFRKLGIRRRHKYTKPLPVIRYSILGLTIISLFFIGTLVINFLDPYSIFGKIANNLVRPVFYASNNLLAKMLSWVHVYNVAPLSYLGFHLITFLVSLFFLVLIIGFVGFGGRLFCNTVCPVGTFLGLISRFSIFKIRLNKEVCTGCVRCANVCKAGCIDLNTKEIDYSRCVMCFNCMTACNKPCVGIKSLYTSRRIPLPAADINKRKSLASFVLLTLSILGISEAGAQVRERNRSRQRNRNRNGEDENKERDQGEDRGYFQNRLASSPPGSLSHEHFNTNCTACNLCISACPGDVLQPSLLEYGFKGMLQPKMDYRKGYCNYECTRCGEICPTGAIRPLTVETKKVTQIGVVHFTQRFCVVVTEGTACGSCSEHCPTQAVRMIPYKGELTIPEIKPEICIGCGACEHACPVKDPHVAIFVKGHVVHELAELPAMQEDEESTTDVPEEFPF